MIVKFNTFKHCFGMISNLMRVHITYRRGCNSYLIFGCIVTLWEIPIDLAVVKQVVVDQVPAPALVIAAQ